MTKSLTREQMLEIWRRARAIEPLRLDCTADRTDGPDLDSLLAVEMRAWYLDLLDSGPLSALALCNAAPTASVTGSLAGGPLLISGPAGCRRIVSVMFDGWDLPVNVTPGPLPSSAANPFCRRPRAVALAPDRVAVIGARGVLRELNCAVDVSDAVYILDDSAFSLIPASPLL